jgi:hypothetical protein
MRSAAWIKGRLNVVPFMPLIDSKDFALANADDILLMLFILYNLV